MAKIGNTLIATWVRSALHMGTVVSLKVITNQPKDEVHYRMKRAFEAFRFVENTCSRFDGQSEIRRLMTQVGTPVQVSPLLFEAIRFAWEVADLTGGVFDMTIGQVMETNGFDRHYLTGEKVSSNLTAITPVSYMDVLLHEKDKTIVLNKPLVLDLGAVAKGMAVDLAKKELEPLGNFVIDAGGDLFAAGGNEQGEPWLIGVRHPIQKEKTICSMRLSDAAVCTSGSYERISANKINTHHLIDPRSGNSPQDLLSCTVVAPFAMMADAFSTAAFIFGAAQGINQLECVGLDGLFIDTSLEVQFTKGMGAYLNAKS